MSKRLVVIFEPQVLDRLPGAPELLVDLGNDFQHATVASPESKAASRARLGQINFLAQELGAFDQDWPELLTEIQDRYRDARPLLVASDPQGLEAAAEREIGAIDAAMLSIDEIRDEIYSFGQLETNSEREILKRYAADNR
jgi:hypothetical protein